MNLKKHAITAVAAVSVLSACVVPAFAADTVKLQSNPSAESSTYSLYTYRYTVTANGVRVRKAPGLDGRVLGYLNKGDIVYDTGRVQNADGYEWIQVRCGGSLEGTIGWIASDYLS